MPTSTFRRAKWTLLPDRQVPPDETTIQCLPDLVEFNAIHNPDHLFCLQAGVEVEHAQSTKITFAEFARAVEQCGYWIRTKVPSATPPVLTEEGGLRKASPVALLLGSDLGLFMYLVALLSLNVPVSHEFLSPVHDKTF